MKTQFNNKLKITALITLMIGGTLLTKAQDNGATTRPKKLYGGFGHFTFSGEQLDVSGLNKTLKSNGYGSLGNVTASFGGGGMFCINSFLIGGGGAWLLDNNAHSSDNRLNMKGGYGYINFGYVVHTGRRSVLYPTLGVGTGGYNIAISKKTQSGDFTQQLNSPTGMITAQAGGLILNAQITYMMFCSKSEKQGFCAGLRLGYRYSPGSWQTTVNGARLDNSPKINLNGLYASLIIGGGSFGYY